MKKRIEAHKTALTGMLFALACVLSVAESVLTAPLMLPPGIKLGLANIVVMYAFLLLGKGPAFLLVVLKAAFSLLTRGVTAGFLSFCGGAASFLILLLLHWLCRQKESFWFLSVSGAIGHNLGQIIAASVLLGTGVYGYAPVLVLSGAVVGTLTSVLLKALLPALKKLGLIKKDLPEK
ncbi:MAG: Gx transporter family protein [Oscillospiraceae bacterium]|nr:Gx transporter family protein [Oscillospiraceae bacterium]